MTDLKTLPPLPDRLSSDPRSPHHVAGVFEHDIGVRFNGKERHDVAEFCVSEGWIKVAAARTKDRRGNPLLIKLKGTVQAYYRGLDGADGAAAAAAEPAATPTPGPAAEAVTEPAAESSAEPSIQAPAAPQPQG